MDGPSVETLCTLLGRSRLLPVEQVPPLRERWRREAGAAAEDAGRFCKWLVAGQLLTDYQANVLLRGHADRFFLHDYKLLDRIGAGRMAGVYKAAHRLGAVVAIKVLPPSKAKDPTTLARFQREGWLAMRLDHPNIVRTFQIAEDKGLHYLVMEYLEGETLEEVLKRRGKLPPAEAVRIIHQALLGLECLHEQGMVHRDLNPGNLMLLPGTGTTAATTAGTSVKILDIGLGRALFDDSGAAGPDANLTADGTILGTPDYMAPEQARDSHAADIRSDIYSLGCTLYHALAGQPPYPDSNLVRKMVRHATEPVPVIKKLNPTVPDGLQQILNWMMAKDPAMRYATPQRAAQALQVFLAAGTEKAAPEANPKMRAYLEWLKSGGDAARSSVRATAPAAAPTAPVAVAAPVAAAAPVAVAPPVPLAYPVAPPVPEPAEAKKGFSLGGLSRRDALMLWVGAGILAAAGGTAVVVKAILARRKARQEAEERKE